MLSVFLADPSGFFVKHGKVIFIATATTITSHLGYLHCRLVGTLLALSQVFADARELLSHATTHSDASLVFTLLISNLVVIVVRLLPKLLLVLQHRFGRHILNECRLLPSDAFNIYILGVICCSRTLVWKN